MEEEPAYEEHAGGDELNSHWYPPRGRQALVHSLVDAVVDPEADH